MLQNSADGFREQLFRRARAIGAGAPSLLLRAGIKFELRRDPRHDLGLPVNDRIGYPDSDFTIVPDFRMPSVASAHIA